MDVESSGIPLATILFFLLLSVIFPPPFSAANELFLPNKTRNSSISFHNLVSSTVFTIKGKVYPNGGYTVTLNIGNPSHPFDLTIDTGSDLTWVQCDKQCNGCTLDRDKLYKPHNNFVKCADPLCVAVSKTPSHPCPDPSADCEFEIHYADRRSSEGVLVRDVIPLRSPDGTLLNPVPKLAFGCANDLKYFGARRLPEPGILGLSKGEASILTQLRSQGVICNVVGHCLSGKGGRYLFFGDKYIPLSGIVWSPLVQSSSVEHYMTGPANLYFDGKPTPVKGLDQLTFDSGSTATYFNSEAFKGFLDPVLNNLKHKPLTRITFLSPMPFCWRGAKRFKSVRDVKGYFKPLALSFPHSGNSQFQLPPEAYLFITEDKGYVCLGIRNGSLEGLGDRNTIGAVSRRYDNENHRIGWGPANCKIRPRS